MIHLKKYNKRTKITENRCRNCVHFRCGHAYNEEWITTICEMKPKIVKKPKYEIFYQANPLSKICDKFKSKNKDHE